MLPMPQSEVYNLNRRKHMTIIVKPTNDCNLDCKYCYDKPIRKSMPKTKMSLEMFERIIQMANVESERVTILWHGGEPTLMGHDFYYAANDIMCKYYATSFEQQMQTNGLAIYNDEKWIHTFVECGIQPGTSYDGTYQYMRSEKDNKKSYLKKVIELFDESHLASKGSITIIHKDNIYNLIDLYEFLKEEFNGEYYPTFNIGFSTEETNFDKFKIDGEIVYAEFSKLYTHMLHDNTNSIISETNFVSSIIRLLKPDTYPMCENMDCRDNWLTILADGTLIPCSRFSVYYNFGNINDYSSIKEIYASEKFKDYYNKVDERYERLCKNCKAFQMCHGGCNAIFLRNRIEDEQLYCDHIKSLWLAAYDSFQKVDTTKVLNKKIGEILNNERVIHPYLISKYLKTEHNIDFDYIVDIKNLDINKFIDSKQYKLTLLFNSISDIPFQYDNILSLEQNYSKCYIPLKMIYTRMKDSVHDILEG